jgi:hypothetical protein
MAASVADPLFPGPTECLIFPGARASKELATLDSGSFGRLEKKHQSSAVKETIDHVLGFTEPTARSRSGGGLAFRTNHNSSESNL